MSVNVQIPPYGKQIWDALHDDTVRRIIIYGGRGGAKSRTIAQLLELMALEGRLRVLCAREIQKSISDSVKRLLDDLIILHSQGSNFESQRDKIKVANGGEFFFAGLQDANKIKSYEGIDICWVEEAQTVSQASIDLLEPTIRKAGSKLIYTFNPAQKTDPIYQQVLQPRDDTLCIEVNYNDNPWFWDTALVADMEWDKKNRPETYQHVWRGKPQVNTDAQIFKGIWSVGEIPKKPEELPYYHGLDWGFAQDPVAIVRCWIDDDARKLYIDAAAAKVGVEIVDTPDFISRVDTSRMWKITADNARPEMISHMKNNGFNIEGAKKGAGSIEGGISFLKGYDIVIAPELTDVQQEFTFYSYKMDRKTGEILPVPADSFNHYIDALRYAVEKLTMAKKSVVTTVTGFSPLG